MDGHYVSMEVHEEFAKRMEEEHARQNKRIDKLEKTVEEYYKLSSSVEKLALSVQTMVTEQKSQGERLKSLEGKDGEMWRKIVGYIATTIVGIVIGFIFKQIGM